MYNNLFPGLDLSDPKQLAEFARPGHKIRLKKPMPESSDRTIGNVIHRIVLTEYSK